MKIEPGQTIVTSTFLLDLLGACILENDPKVRIQLYKQIFTHKHNVHKIARKHRH